VSIRVLVVDDQQMFRVGLVAILAAQSDIEVVGEADDGAAALA
jgi:DNA-binding NarL/FixJ family response regulator